MGKTKIKTIDDNQPIEEKPHSVRQSRTSRGKDELVEKLKLELGINRKDSEISETTGTPSSSDQSKKARKPGKTKPRSKKYLEKVKDLDKTKTYPLNEAIDLVKKLSYSKFDGTLEAHINTIQTGLRGFVSLPFASGKKLRILTFEGDDSVIEQISKGKIDFDILITTPEWMSKLAKVAKVLGPKGLMPNPKNNTIASSEDGIKKAVESFQTGKTEYKTEAKSPIIHLALGKLSQPNEQLEANVKMLLVTIGKTRIKKVVLSPTMGSGVKLDLASI